MDTEPAVKKPRKGDTGQRGPAGLAPQDLGAPLAQRAVASNPKTLKGTMSSLTPDASPINQTQDLPFLLSTAHWKTSSCLPHPAPPSVPRSTAWPKCAEMDNHLPARTKVGMVNGRGGPIPHSTRTAHDLSLGIVMIRFQGIAPTTIGNSRQAPKTEADWRGGSH